MARVQQPPFDDFPAVDPRMEELAAEGLCDVPEAMRFLGVSRSKAYDLMERGLLKYARVGWSRRIPRKALRSFAAACHVG